MCDRVNASIGRRNVHRKAFSCWYIEGPLSSPSKKLIPFDVRTMDSIMTYCRCRELIRVDDSQVDQIDRTSSMVWRGTGTTHAPIIKGYLART